MSVKCPTPNLSQSQVVEMVKRLFMLTPSEICSLPSYEDQNFYVAAMEGGEYVLKIMNSEDSKNHAMIEVQTYAMLFLHQNGLPAQTALPTTSGQLMSMEEIAVMSVKCPTPNLSQSQVVEMVKRLFMLTPSEICSLPSYEDQNFYVAAMEGGEYVLKIMNSEDSKNHAMIEVQTYAMLFLHQNGLPAQTALPTTSGQLMSMEEIAVMSVKCPTPNLSQSQVVEMVKRLFMLTPSEICSLPSYEDQNFYVAAMEGGEYVLKIMNSEDSKNHAMIEVQTYAMLFLHQNGLPAQTALPTTSGQLMSMEEIDCGYGCQKYLVRLLTYLPGTTISKAPLTPQLLYETGKMAARMDKILLELKHPHLNTLQRDTLNCTLSNVPLLETYISVLDGHPLQEVVKSVIHQYKTSVAPKCSDFHKCIIHGDFNDLNVLVRPDDLSDGYRISGIIDFGDMSSGYYIYELAITIMHMMTVHPKPIEVAGAVLAGWESVLPLKEVEKDCLYVLVLSRFCQFLVLPRRALSLRPDNAKYLIRSFRECDQCLHQLWELGKEQVETVWFQSAAQFSDRT